MSDGGEIIPESRGLNGGRAARLHPITTGERTDHGSLIALLAVRPVVKFALNSLDGSGCFVGHGRRRAIYYKSLQQSILAAHRISGCPGTPRRPER
jgi:hypothetical protein